MVAGLLNWPQGTFVSKDRFEELKNKNEEEGKEKPDDEVWFEAAEGFKKGHIYGVGTAGPLYFSPLHRIRGRLYALIIPVFLFNKKNRQLNFRTKFWKPSRRRKKRTGDLEKRPGLERK